MENLAENHIVRFISIKKKKEGVFAHFKVKGIRAGMVYSASIDVDISAAEVDASDSLEQIVETCAKLAVKEFKKSELQFEGLSAL